LSLVDFLHDELDLTGTKFCCGIGVCRACTVAVRSRPGAPSRPVLGCSTPAAALDGAEITTVEGLGSAERLSDLQRAFLDHFAFQCGYCTPGFLTAATILLERLREAPVERGELDAAIEDAVGAHICRCTGYVRYHRAIRSVVESTPGLVR
ncbi:MAG: 2Fe-2S iron-sulfur cluster-binding protein, partial [Gemmatimonadota bacterium]|nr:2Fe-2S iron-sulfur cluster-binding protein [Gemmatimonadota bacterium]